MKRPVAFYMLLIMASIFSVFLPESGIRFCFPYRFVLCGISFWGTGNESVIWQNIILEITGTTGAYRIGGGGGALCQRFTDADCFSQSFGRSVGTGHQFGSQYGSCFCGASFG